MTFQMMSASEDESSKNELITVTKIDRVIDQIIFMSVNGNFVNVNNIFICTRAFANHCHNADLCSLPLAR